MKYRQCFLIPVMVCLLPGSVLCQSLMESQFPVADTLVSNIPWDDGGQTGVHAIEHAFRNARAGENSQLASSLDTNLTLPAQATWDAMSDGDHALFLLNAERTVRGLEPLEFVDPNVTAVAQAYAEYMDSHGILSHSADGQSLTQRLDANSSLNGNYQSTGTTELISWAYPAPVVASSIYAYLYTDQASSWLHRQAVLYSPFTDDFDTTGSEGMVGVGIASASGSPYLCLLVVDPTSGYVRPATAVESVAGSVPKEFTLAQNYPNPFNPATTIEFTVPEDGHAAVRLYDATGRELATLMDQDAQAGRLYRLSFDASRYSSGTYFYQLESGGRTLTKKMTLVK